MNLTQLKGAVDLAQLRHDADPSEQNKEKLKAAQEAYAAKAKAEATADTPDTGGAPVTEVKNSNPAADTVKTGVGAGGVAPVTGTKDSNPPADTVKTGVTSGSTAPNVGVVEKTIPDPAATPDGTGSDSSSEEKKSE